MLRRQHLRIEPLCRMCDQEGRTTAANTVDHIRPHNGDWSLFVDPSNLQSLCHLHHSASKQRLERRGFDVAVDDRGFPIDPRHPANR